MPGLVLAPDTSGLYTKAFEIDIVDENHDLLIVAAVEQKIRDLLLVGGVRIDTRLKKLFVMTPGATQYRSDLMMKRISAITQRVHQLGCEVRHGGVWIVRPGVVQPQSAVAA